MSRSRRKSPYRGCGSSSEKYEKQKANRKLRKKCKAAIRQGEEVMPEKKEISNVWDWPKDGRFEIDKNDPRERSK
jgi:hypothetical protein